MGRKVNQTLVDFYSGAAPDHKGRTIMSMLDWPDPKLEAVHDYIQWMFPLPEASQFNRSAPLLDAETIQEFETNAVIRTNMLRSYHRMLNFYGFQTDLTKQVTRAADFRIQSENWLHANNHNHLRITRILRCLTLTGFAPEAKEFLKALTKLYRETDDRITERTFSLWRSAVPVEQ